MQTYWNSYKWLSKPTHLKNWWKCLVTSGHPHHTSPCCQWLLCLAVALNLLIILYILMVCFHHLFPNIKKTTFGWERVSQWWWCHAVDDSVNQHDWSLFNYGIQTLHQQQKNWFVCKWDYFENKTHLNTFHDTIIISLYTFHTTLVFFIFVQLK